MKAVLRGIVSMAFATIEDQKTQQRIPPKAKDVPTLSRPVITPPSPVPADEVYKPLSSTDPIPFGAVTKVKSAEVTYDTSKSNNGNLPAFEEKSIEVEDSKPQDLIPDNLAEIKGLNPIAVMGLNKRGIVTFLQIANLTDQEIADIEDDLDLPGCFNRFSWRYQSRQLQLDK